MGPLATLMTITPPNLDGSTCPPRWERIFIPVPGEGLRCSQVSACLSYLSRRTDFKVHENTCCVPEITCLSSYKLPLRCYLYSLNFKTQSSLYAGSGQKWQSGEKRGRILKSFRSPQKRGAAPPLYGKPPCCSRSWVGAERKTRFTEGMVSNR